MVGYHLSAQVFVFFDLRCVLHGGLPFVGSDVRLFLSVRFRRVLVRGVCPRAGRASGGVRLLSGFSVCGSGACAFAPVRQLSLLRWSRCGCCAMCVSPDEAAVSVAQAR